MLMGEEEDGSKSVWEMYMYLTCVQSDRAGVPMFVCETAKACP